VIFSYTHFNSVTLPTDTNMEEDEEDQLEEHKTNEEVGRLKLVEEKRWT